MKDGEDLASRRQGPGGVLMAEGREEIVEDAGHAHFSGTATFAGTSIFVTFRSVVVKSTRYRTLSASPAI